VKEIIESVETTFSRLDPDTKPFESVVVTADSGFSSEEAVSAVLNAGIDAYIADPQFRKRDPRFAKQQEYRAKSTGRTFKGYPEHCGNCPLRNQCLRSPNSPVRQVTKTDRGIRHNKKSAIRRMMERFDTERVRHYYSRRMGIAEPVFGNTRATLGMDRFTLRGRRKVDAQWKLYCIVHNIGKLARYGPSFADALV